MGDVFFLGAGFSRAVSTEMPITRELGRAVLGLYKIKDGI
jgi:hypothetical protein